MKLPITPSFKLTGKRALVVGGATGIGLACSSALAEAGAEVVIASRNINTVKQVVKALKERGDTAHALELDISDLKATEKIIHEQKPFDILVNSAGLAIHSPALETEVDDFDAVMNVNVRGAYFLTRSIAKKLIDSNKSGSLINISSQMSKVGGIDRAVYCASKHAVEGFTKSMAIEWGKNNIRVNTICPTFIRTPLTEQTFSNPERIRWIEEKIKLGRVGELEDVMGAVLYLASDASALVTGASLLVDGGWTAE